MSSTNKPMTRQSKKRALVYTHNQSSKSWEIPRWAKITKCSPSNSNPQEDEFEFHQITHMHTSNAINSMFETVIHNHDLSSLFLFLDSFIPTRKSQPKLDPKRLPMAMIQSSSDILDRSMFVEYLAHSLSHSSNGSSAVCTLTANCTNGKELSVKDFIFFILLECLSRESEYKKQHFQSSVSSITSTQIKFAKRSNVAAVDTLLKWAKQTNDFDSIIVILEDPEVIPLPTLDELIESLSNMRSLHNIPISFIVMSTIGNEISFISRSSIKNVTLQRFQLPNTNNLFHDLWNQFFSKFEKMLPMFYNKTICQIENTFQHYHFSFMTSIQHIQMATALFFSQPGSFLASFLDSKLTSQFEKQSTLMLVDPNQRSLYTSISYRNLMCQLRSTQNILRTFHISISLIQNTMESFDPDQKLLFHHIIQPSTMKIILHKLHHHLKYSMLEHDDIYYLLQRWKTDISNELTSFQNLDLQQIGEFKKLRDVPLDINDEILFHDENNLHPKYLSSMDHSTFEKATILLQSLDECIILFHSYITQTTDIQEKDIETYIDSCFAQVIEYIIDAYTQWNQNTKSNHIMKQMTSSKQFPIMAHPRQAVTSALLNPHYFLQSQSSSFQQKHDTCIAFHVFKERRITQYEWYTLFSSKVQNIDGCNTEYRFIYAVYELLHCGLIKKETKSASKKDITYERLLVWTSTE